MLKDEYNHLDNVRQVNAFIDHHNIPRGSFFDTQISVEDCRGNIVFANSCQCYISYNHKSDRYDVNIYWNESKAVLKRQKLNGIYNTRNYKMHFEESNLVIEIDKRFIVIKFGNV